MKMFGLPLIDPYEETSETIYLRKVYADVDRPDWYKLGNYYIQICTVKKHNVIMYDWLRADLSNLL